MPKAVTSPGVPRGPRCARCRNHGFTALLRGHTGQCRFRMCRCWKCALITQRTQILAMQRRLSKSEHQARSSPADSEAPLEGGDGTSCTELGEQGELGSQLETAKESPEQSSSGIPYMPPPIHPSMLLAPSPPASPPVPLQLYPCCPTGYSCQRLFLHMPTSFIEPAMGFRHYHPDGPGSGPAPADIRTPMFLAPALIPTGIPDMARRTFPQPGVTRSGVEKPNGEGREPCKVSPVESERQSAERS